jgi:HEAT repeats
MVPQSLLRWILLLEVFVLAGLVLFYVGHGVWSSRRERRAKEIIADVRSAFLSAVVTGQGLDTIASVLEGLPVRLQIRLFLSLSTALTGSQRKHLGDLADRVGITERAARQCLHRNWWTRLNGARLLTSLGSDHPVMSRLLTDPDPLVRAQAAEWAGDDPSGREIPKLLEMLGEPLGVCRFTAQESLLRIGNEAIDPLVEFFGSRPDMTPESALEVVAGIASARLLDVTVPFASDERTEVRAMAARALGAIGAEATLAPLMELLHDPDPRPRAEAAKVLGLLGHWPAGPRLSELLRDRSFQVRQEAGLALKALGPPGELLLRRIADGSDSVASAMAKHALQSPGAVPAGRPL